VSVSDPPARLRVTKTAGTTHAHAGSKVRFTIVVRSVGSHTATGVRVCDIPPAHMTFVSVDGAAFSSGRACWMIASLAVGAQRTFTVLARIDANAPTGEEENLARGHASNAAPVIGSATVDVAQSGSPPVSVTG
jgi:uncharacterized repeat protein (TIGR01451 family)